LDAYTKNNTYLGKKSRKQCVDCIHCFPDKCVTIKLAQEKLPKYRYKSFINENQYLCPDFKRNSYKNI